MNFDQPIAMIIGAVLGMLLLFGGIPLTAYIMRLF
ncbi:hypothetical protein R61_164 [Klebsiella phage R6_1]|nr:putative tripartite tricarboxylate transporter permease [Klebsiella phage vB_KpnM-VAC66]WKC55055.1 hypothetical protein R61_164 [Klebsiella phage R6_1]